MNVMAILDYLQKNLKIFNDIYNQNKTKRKETITNPFGVQGGPGSRNAQNKENYGGNS